MIDSTIVRTATGRKPSKEARIVLDTDMAGRTDAFNPAELLLASVAACMIKGIERVTPMLGFDLRGAEVALHGIRQDSPPKMVSITHELIVETDETGGTRVPTFRTSRVDRRRSVWLGQAGGDRTSHSVRWQRVRSFGFP
ncbi:OsmC family protein [Rhizobium sp. 32-5/1]|uniref:OsmC family protein n=1 Tax=Rhizobium sp. 32-5/1 TaxID=3019602 RepID=UPI0032B75610